MAPFKSISLTKNPEVLLILLGVAATLAFSVWQALLNNFVIETAAFTGREIGILQSLREVPGFLAFTTVFVLLVLGYSLNLLTLLALVLAIGLVVDDAIVVVENIHRHIEEGLSPFDAAIKGAREITTPVITMTITLAAVYAPIGFVSGLTGTLFREFAFTLAGAVIVSGTIALTLSPMMCSKLLLAEKSSGAIAQFLDISFQRLRAAYERRLAAVLDLRPVVLLVAVVVLCSCVFLYMTTKKELVPSEDQSTILMIMKAPQYANLDYLEDATQQLYSVYSTVPEKEHVFTINGMGDYRFMLWAGDDAPDTFRIRIWTEDQAGVETDVYDNGFDQEIGGGSIVIHTK